MTPDPVELATFLQTLLEECGLELLKLENLPVNLGKDPCLVLAEAILKERSEP